MRFWLGVLFGTLAMSPIPEVIFETATETMVVYVEKEFNSTPTPVIDSMIDWDEVDRQNDCLWLYLKELGWDITLENVMLVGDWADANGGACLLIGEDNE
jgi:hypothetical protein